MWRADSSPDTRLVTTKNLINIAALFAANAVSAGAQYLIIVLVARRLGPEPFGQYVFALTFGGLAATLCNFGLDRVLIRAIVRQREALPAYFSSAAALRVVLGALTVLGAASILGVLGYAGESRLTVLFIVTSLVLALFSELWRSVLYAAGAMPAEARLRAAGRTVALAGVIAVLLAGGRLLHVSIALAAAGAGRGRHLHGRDMEARVGQARRAFDSAGA